MKAISESEFADVGESAKTKRSRFRPAGELSFHPNAGLSPAIVSGNSRPRDYTLAGRRFIRRFLGIVTSTSNQPKIVARFFPATETEPNQALEPTIRAGTPRAEPRVAPALIAAHL